MRSVPVVGPSISRLHKNYKATLWRGGVWAKKNPLEFGADPCSSEKHRMGGPHLMQGHNEAICSSVQLAAHHIKFNISFNLHTVLHLLLHPTSQSPDYFTRR